MPDSSIKILTKSGIIAYLKKRNHIVNSVNDLNKLLVEMGLQVKNGRYWMTTKKAVPFTIFRDCVANVNSWYPKIVDVICE